MAIADLYALPSGIVSDKAYVHWPSIEPIQENMNALCKLYRDNGYKSATFNVVNFIEQGENFAIADLKWLIQRENNAEPWEFNTTYNLMRTDHGWKVLLCTAYSEKRLKP